MIGPLKQKRIMGSGTSMNRNEINMNNPLCINAVALAFCNKKEIMSIGTNIYKIGRK